MSDTIPPKALVAVERCSSYEQEGVYQALVKVIEAAGGIPLSSPEGKSRILLKPNHLSASGPEKAVTTHPAVMGAMTRYLVEAGHEVYAWDSPGFAGPDAAGAASGNRKAVESAGGTWVTGAGEYEEANPGGRLVRRFVLSDVLKKVDAVISMAKFKNHQLLYTTGALKNMFGLVPGLRKAQFHVRFPDKEHFARMIVDLNEAVPPVFTVMDGIIGMEGHGPGNGSPREIGLLLASQNPAALDIVFADIAGYDGLSLPVQAEAAERERWFDQDRPVREQIHIAGASMDELRIPDFDRIEKTGDVDMIGRFLP
ncbi:MAG: DUF362 domain-containing protein, partial [Spirochaetales bacterium]|nr:DUF362 domain-containing protein [Spirochaetales bacterium]MCF7938475.1 DUF362 domain-containing protein [Spirochaetales bacterium]